MGGYQRHLPHHQGRLPPAGHQDADLHPLLDRHLRSRVPRQCQKPQRLRDQVLHRRWQLRSRRPELASLLRQRSHAGSRQHPSQQRNPKSFLLDFNAWFDFLSQVPESNHAGLMLMSDYATPKGWIHMSGYGCHTFGMVNAAGERKWVKFHWKCHQEKVRFDGDEVEKIQGVDPDYSKRELYELLEGGGEVKWTMQLQVMDPEDVEKVNFDPFDVTKVWPRGQYPLIDVGVLTLNRTPEDYHRDVEQAAFSPGSLVPGIETSPDTLLQWRAFFYRDAQYHRLATANIHQIPVNCPFMAKFHSPDNFNGAVRVDAN